VAQLLDLFQGEHLAPVQRRFRILVLRADPYVHAQVQVAQHQHQRLQPLGQVERNDAELERLGRVCREEQRVTRVAVAHEVGVRNVALARAGRQAGRGTDALDVPDDRRHFGEVGQARELGHQIQAGSRCGGHGPCAGPPSAHDHAQRGQLVLRLDDCKVGFARLRVGAQPGQVLAQSVHHARRRGDGIPGHKADAAEDRAQRGRRVAVRQDLVLVEANHALHAVRVGFGQVRLRPLMCAAHHAHVELDGLGLTVEVPRDRGLDLPHVDVEQEGQHAYIHHVGDIVLQLECHVGFLDQLADRHRVVGDIRSPRRDRQGVVVQNDAAFCHVSHVLRHGATVQADRDLVWIAVRQVAILAQADDVPRGQALDVAREQVLAGDGDAHLEECPQQHAVARLAA